MVLAQSVPNPQRPETTLLRAGFDLDADSIARLKSLNVPSIWVRYPNLDFLDEVIDTELVQKQQELYGELKNKFTESQELNLGKLGYSEYVARISDLFQHMISAPAGAGSFIADLYGGSEDVFMHGTITASLALLVGMKLEAYLMRERPQVPVHLATNLTPLGVGCLLHDMGKLQIPAELRGFRLTASDKGLPEWQAHTEAGFEMMKSGLDAAAGQVVINHHQHFDGSGFPVRKALPGQTEPTQTLKGSAIHVFCRIAAVVDRFDNFRYLPDGRVAPLVVALKRMRNPGYIKWFDPTVYDAFIRTTAAFVVGEQVTLSDGQTCVVVEQNEGQPCRPVVRVIDPEKAVQPEQQEPAAEKADIDINLTKRSDLHIARIGDFDVTPYLH